MTMCVFVFPSSRLCTRPKSRTRQLFSRHFYIFSFLPSLFCFFSSFATSIFCPKKKLDSARFLISIRLYSAKFFTRFFTSADVAEALLGGETTHSTVGFTPSGPKCNYSASSSIRYLWKAAMIGSCMNSGCGKMRNLNILRSCV